MPKGGNDPASGPQRVAPIDAAADVVERIVPRRYWQLEDGDVVIVRELVPRVNPAPITSPVQWRYTLRVHPEPAWHQRFSSFATAASEGEQLASERGARLMLVEDDLPTLLANYRSL